MKCFQCPLCLYIGSQRDFKSIPNRNNYDTGKVTCPHCEETFSKFHLRPTRVLFGLKEVKRSDFPTVDEHII